MFANQRCTWTERSQTRPEDSRSLLSCFHALPHTIERWSFTLSLSRTAHLSHRPVTSLSHTQKQQPLPSSIAYLAPLPYREAHTHTVLTDEHRDAITFRPRKIYAPSACIFGGESSTHVQQPRTDVEDPTLPTTLVSCCCTSVFSELTTNRRRRRQPREYSGRIAGNDKRSI